MLRRTFLGETAGAAVALRTSGTPPQVTRRSALVLSGGGAPGAYEAGVVAGLHDAGYRFDVICGTSVGAINGALLAQDDLDGLEQLWKTIASRKVVQLKPQIALVGLAVRRLMDGSSGALARPYNFFHDLYRAWDGGSILKLVAVLESSPMENLLEKVLDLERIRRPFAYGLTNLDLSRGELFYVDPTGSLVIADQRLFPARRIRQAAGDGERFVQSVRASGAIPGMLDPVLIEVDDPAGPVTYAYGDGGAATNTPIRLARRLGATDIVSVFVNPPQQASHRPKTFLGALLSAYSTSQIRLTQDQIDAAPLAGEARSFSLTAVYPQQPLKLGAFEFGNQAALDAAFELGRGDGRRGPQNAVPTLG